MSDPSPRHHSFCFPGKKSIIVCGCKPTMSHTDLETYLKYRTLEDMLKVIVYSAQSALGLTPMLYHIVHNRREILFIQTGTIGGIIVHFVNQERKPKEKFIQLKRFTGEFSFVDSIGTDAQSIYVPILELEGSTLRFPL